MRSQTLKLLGVSAAAIVALAANPAMARHHHHHHHHKHHDMGMIHGGAGTGHPKTMDDCPTTNPNCHLDPHPKVP